MIRLLIVDDQKILLDGLARLFELYEDLEVVGELPFSEMAETACARLKPHVVLMDICMEGKTSGIECTRRIKKHFPRQKIIIMTGFQDVHFVELAREAGADSFIYKESAADQFVDCIRRTMAGEHLFPDVQERTTFPLRMTEQAPHTPVPQPTLVPVRPRRRITSARVSLSGSQMNIRSAPLILRVIF